jgi:hypothetical protein
MAYIANYERDSEIIPDAYFRVQNIHTQNADYEFYEPVEDPNDPTISERVSWKTRIESKATVYVWPDLGARENRAYPLAWFPLEFVYDPKSTLNIYAQAYEAVKQRFPGGQDI